MHKGSCSSDREGRRPETTMNYDDDYLKVNVKNGNKGGLNG